MNQMLNSTLEEKENLVTEMILTTVNPTTLVMGKILAVFAVGLVQILVLLAPVVIGYVFFRDRLNIPDLDLSSLRLDPGTMVVAFLLLVGGFVLFTGVLVAIPVTAMLRNALGTLDPVTAGIVIAELFVLRVVVLRVAVQLFRTGSIAYTDKLNPRAVLGRRRPAVVNK